VISAYQRQRPSASAERPQRDPTKGLAAGDRALQIRKSSCCSQRCWSTGRLSQPTSGLRRLDRAYGAGSARLINMARGAGLSALLRLAGAF
jgi:hypothetical protein